MAKKRNVPCSGGCGTLLWSGGKPAVRTEPTCRPCRRRLGTSSYLRPPATADEIAARRDRKRTTSREWQRLIRNARRPRPRTGRCHRCSVDLGDLARVHCDDCKRLMNREKCQRRRDAGRGRKKHDGLSIFDLGDRDGWRCHLCRRKVHKHLRWPHPGSPTFDHLVPVSDDPDDSATNLALAHARCNIRRKDDGAAQLRLVG